MGPTFFKMFEFAEHRVMFTEHGFHRLPHHCNSVEVDQDRHSNVVACRDDTDPVSDPHQRVESDAAEADAPIVTILGHVSREGEVLGRRLEGE